MSGAVGVDGGDGVGAAAGKVLMPMKGREWKSSE